MSSPPLATICYMAALTLYVVSVSATNVVSNSTSAEEEHTRGKRLAIHPSQWALHLWPGGVVPYEIAPHYDAWERSVILSGMAEFPKHTCISFRPRMPGDRYYLAINKYYNLERCFSYIGRQTSNIFLTREGNVETQMRLDPSCLRFNGRGTVMHELMHIIGFYHEHQRDDRDPRITGSATHYNYKIYPRYSTYYMGRYDPTSIMHYNFPGIVYPRTYFSASDIWRINTLYRCPTRAPTTARTTTFTTARPAWTTRPTFTTRRWFLQTTTTSPTRAFSWPTAPTAGPVATTRPPTTFTTSTGTRTTFTTRTTYPGSTSTTTRGNTFAPNLSNTVDDDEQISRNGIFRRMRRI